MPDQKPLSGLFESAASRGGFALCDLWTKTGLPEPQDGQFERGSDADHVFLNEYGLVISIRYAKTNVFGSESIFSMRNIVHDLIVQPLWRAEISEQANLEICPGLRPPIGAPLAIVSDMMTRLNAAGLSFSDPQKDNIGILRDPLTLENHPVLLDRGAFRTNESFHSDSAPLQTHIFGRLKELAATAFMQDTQGPANKFFRECRRIAKPA